MKPMKMTIKLPVIYRMQSARGQIFIHMLRHKSAKELDKWPFLQFMQDVWI